MKNCGVLIVIALVILFIIVNPMEIESFRGRRNRRRWWGPRWGYRYNPPPYRRYISWWNPFTWYSDSCKNGCINLGNGNWGCPYPGNGFNDCWFARDCNGCGY